MDPIDTAPPDLNEQHRIEMPDGVVLSGIGGDVEAITEELEQRYEELHPEAAPAEPASPIVAAPAEPVEKPRTRGQKRFDQLTAEREAEKRRADAAEARTKELEAKLSAPLAPQPQAAAEPPKPAPVAGAPTRPEPQEEEVGTKYAKYSDFTKDQSLWVAEQERVKLLAEIDARTGSRIEADRASRTRADFVNNTVFPSGRAAYTDFDAVLSAAEARGQKVPLAVHNAILQLPNPEHAIYALAKDDAKANEIIRTANDPVRLGIALAQFMPREPVASPASTAPVVRTTNASAPPQPVGAGTRTTSPSVEEAADISQEAYRRARGLRAVR